MNPDFAVPDGAADMVDRLSSAIRRNRAAVHRFSYRSMTPRFRGNDRSTECILEIRSLDDWLTDPDFAHGPDPGGLMKEIERMTGVLLNYKSASFEFAERMMLLWAAEAQRIEKELKR